MKNILIVEDDINIHEIIDNCLTNEGYKCFHAYSGTEAMLMLEKNHYDLILLDLMLPALNGEEIIKKVQDIPIIVLSAKVAVDDKVNCLLLGANDYITKPFNLQELLARIKVQLRNSKNINKEGTLKYQNLELLNDGHTLLLNKNIINLTKTEYAILKNLLSNPNQVIPKNRLIDLISIDTLDGDENSLKVHISNIRRKLRKYSDVNYIEAVWGIGFKMANLTKS